MGEHLPTEISADDLQPSLERISRALVRRQGAPEWQETVRVVE